MFLGCYEYFSSVMYIKVITIGDLKTNSEVYNFENKSFKAFFKLCALLNHCIEFNVFKTVYISNNLIL